MEALLSTMVISIRGHTASGKKLMMEYWSVASLEKMPMITVFGEREKVMVLFRQVGVRIANQLTLLIKSSEYTNLSNIKTSFFRSVEEKKGLLPLFSLCIFLLIRIIDLESCS